MIDRLRNTHRRCLIAKQSGQEVTACGGGRCDSPRFSSKYFSYALMNFGPKLIFYLEFLDKCKVGGCSPNMEKIGFRRTMASLLCEVVKINEVITDASSSIKYVMAKIQ